MARTLDLTSLRSFATVAELGGVTKAAQRLNLTQSAVSMQIKRLEESLDRTLLRRTGRGVAISPDGEVLLSYARRMVRLNDEAWRRMTADDFEGEVRIGAPGDLIQPHMPIVLKRFRREFPRAKLQLATSFTVVLLKQLERGELDLILTTERGLQPGGVTIDQVPLKWYGAPGGDAYKRDPLPFGSERHCTFRNPAISALETAGRAWSVAIDTTSDSAIFATTAADLAVTAQLMGHQPHGLEQIPDGVLPDLPPFHINMYRSGAGSALMDAIAEMIADAYQE